MRSSDFVITRMITDRIGLHSVLLPLLIIIIIIIIISSSSIVVVIIIITDSVHLHACFVKFLLLCQSHGIVMRNKSLFTPDM